MLFKVLSGTVLATALGVANLGAQSIARLGGPANPPPASFQGQQFVDSRGCVFLRAGFGKAVNWVPRVDRSHKPLCGFPPTGGTQVATAVQADMAPDSAAKPAPVVAVTLPAPTASQQPTAPSAPTVVAKVPVAPSIATAIVASTSAPTPAPAPRVVSAAAALAPLAATPLLATHFAQTQPTPAQPSPAPAPTVLASAAQPAAPTSLPSPGFFPGALFRDGARTGLPWPAGTGPTTPGPSYQTAGAASGLPQVACPTAAPQLERVLLRNGGTAFVCTQGDGTLNGWLPPNFPQGANFGAALSPLLAANAMEGTAGLGTGGSYGLTTPRPQSAASNAIPKPPIGYKLAWEDDRLNPLRGVGTAQGQAQQDLIWTRRVPAGLVAAQPLPLLPRWVLPVLQTNVSTMSAPVARAAAPAAPGGRMVQIGSYGQPANAQGAARRLATLGLPVATGQITTGSKALQIVYAGPFATNSEAEAALSAARGAGFGDAFLN